MHIMSQLHDVRRTVVEVEPVLRSRADANIPVVITFRLLELPEILPRLGS